MGWGKRWEGCQIGSAKLFRPPNNPDAGGATLLRKISNATLACRLVPVLRGSGGERDDTSVVLFQPPKPGRDAPHAGVWPGGGCQYQGHGRILARYIKDGNHACWRQSSLFPSLCAPEAWPVSSPPPKTKKRDDLTC